jgi:hypothetical protein
VGSFSVKRGQGCKRPYRAVTDATYHTAECYVPINGGDDSAAIEPKYECCKGRREAAALDAETGKII